MILLDLTVVAFFFFRLFLGFLSLFGQFSDSVVLRRVSFVPQSLDRVQSPRAFSPGLINVARSVFQNANKSVLVAEITDPKPEMMSQCRQVKLHVNRKWFFDGAHGQNASRFQKLPLPNIDSTTSGSERRVIVAQ